MGADNIGQFKVTETDNKIAASEDGSEIDISKKNNFASKIQDFKKQLDDQRAKIEQEEITGDQPSQKKVGKKKPLKIIKNFIPLKKVEDPDERPIGGGNNNVMTAYPEGQEPSEGSN